MLAALAVSLAGITVVISNPQIAEGATFGVDTCNDSGMGSLRASVLEADVTPGNNIIDFSLSCSEIVLTSGPIPISNNPLTIDGPGPSALAVSGSGVSSEIFEIEAGATASISGLSIVNGQSSNGGGISNGGTLTLTHCDVSDNNATADGGGIFNTGTLTIDQSTVDSNGADVHGGGIFNSGTLTLTRSTVRSNDAASLSGTSDGGGIYNDSGTVNISSSTVWANVAEGSDGDANGGGIYIGGGTVKLTNSTVASNTAESSLGATAYGGGIDAGGGSVSLDYATVAANVATSSGGGIDATASVTLSSTILSANGSGDCAGPEITDGGYNFDSDGTCGLSGLGDLSGTVSLPMNPQLGPVAANGGPTMTMALATTSPALSRIPLATNGCGTTIASDQRGGRRPQVVSCDMGAYELGGYGYAQVSAEGDHSCALKAGNVFCWGQNSTYQNGRPGPDSGVSLVVNTNGQASGVPLAGITQVASAESFTCALRSPGGTVWCWGQDGEDSLGRPGPNTSIPLEVNTNGLPVGIALTGVKEVVAFSQSACALIGGHVWCWGYNGSHQLGRANPIASSVPLEVHLNGTGGGASLAGVSQISAGESHVCAVQQPGGHVFCWGLNQSRELGRQVPAVSSAPRKVHLSGTGAGALLSGVTEVSAGDAFTCALRAPGGTVWCWGLDTWDQLGRSGANTSMPMPINTNGLETGTPLAGITQISAGRSLTCALKSPGGNVLCWGADQFDQLGRVGSNSGMPLTVNTNGLVVGTALAGVLQISAGGWHACALLVTSQVDCWGMALAGQLGDNTFVNRPAPVTMF